MRRCWMSVDHHLDPPSALDEAWCPFSINSWHCRHWATGDCCFCGLPEAANEWSD